MLLASIAWHCVVWCNGQLTTDVENTDLWPQNLTFDDSFIASQTTGDGTVLRNNVTLTTVALLEAGVDKEGSFIDTTVWHYIQVVTSLFGFGLNLTAFLVFALKGTFFSKTLRILFSHQVSVLRDAVIT